MQGDLLGVYTANYELQQEQQEIELITACTYRLLCALGPCFLHSEIACRSFALNPHFESESQYRTRSMNLCFICSSMKKAFGTLKIS